MPLAPPNPNSRYKQGYFIPKHPKKYVGDVSGVVYRSSLEHKFMSYCDNHPSIVRWCSEEIKIPYIHPVTRKFHWYYPDFLVEVKNTKGMLIKYLVEIKPDSQTKPPKGKKKTKRLLKEHETFNINQSKWAHASEWCKDRGMVFKIFTEKDIK